MEWDYIGHRAPFKLLTISSVSVLLDLIKFHSGKVDNFDLGLFSLNEAANCLTCLDPLICHSVIFICEF